jgi:hypothetical protein
MNPSILPKIQHHPWSANYNQNYFHWRNLKLPMEQGNLQIRQGNMVKFTFTTKNWMISFSESEGFKKLDAFFSHSWTDWLKDLYEIILSTAKSDCLSSWLSQKEWSFWYCSEEALSFRTSSISIRLFQTNDFLACLTMKELLFLHE